MPLRETFIERAGLGPAPDLRAIVEAVRAIPYGRPPRRNAEGVLDAWRGTCSSKHDLLAALLAEAWPETSIRLVHRVYRVTPELARADFGEIAARAVPPEGLVDVHTYAVVSIDGRPTRVDVTFAGPPWDGRSDMPLACGPGEDVDAGADPAATKAALVAERCDPAVREPFIAALSTTAHPT